MNTELLFFLICMGGIALTAIWANWIPSLNKKREQGCHTCALAGYIGNKPKCDKCFPNRYRDADGDYIYPNWESRS